MREIRYKNLIRSIFEKFKMTIFTLKKTKSKKNKKNQKKDFTNWKLSGMIYITEAKKAFRMCLWKKLKKWKHFNIQCIIYYLFGNWLNCFFILQKTNLKLILKKLKKIKKMVDNVEYIWYIINAPKKRRCKKRLFFENWAKCQFE